MSGHYSQSVSIAWKYRRAGIDRPPVKTKNPVYPVSDTESRARVEAGSRRRGDPLRILGTVISPAIKDRERKECTSARVNPRSRTHLCRRWVLTARTFIARDVIGPGNDVFSRKTSSDETRNGRRICMGTSASASCHWLFPTTRKKSQGEGGREV